MAKSTFAGPVEPVICSHLGHVSSLGQVCLCLERARVFKRFLMIESLNDVRAIRCNHWPYVQNQDVPKWDCCAEDWTVEVTAERAHQAQFARLMADDRTPQLPAPRGTRVGNTSSRPSVRRRKVSRILLRRASGASFGRLSAVKQVIERVSGALRGGEGIGPIRYDFSLLSGPDLYLVVRMCGGPKNFGCPLDFVGDLRT